MNEYDYDDKPEYFEDSEQIEREIAETRARIDSKAAELKSNLTPPSVTHLKDSLAGGGRKLMESFRDNPLPVTLIGAGLGWLMLRDAAVKRNEGLPIYRPESSMSAGKIKEAVKSVGAKVAEGAASVKDTAVRGAHKATDWFNFTLQDNPLILAVASLGVGLAAGLALPISQAEKDTAGKLGEKLVGKVLDKSAGALEETPEPSTGAGL